MGQKHTVKQSVFISVVDPDPELFPGSGIIVWIRIQQNMKEQINKTKNNFRPVNSGLCVL